MTDELEDTVNEAIEFFPGRVKRDQWAAQSRTILDGGVWIDEGSTKPNLKGMKKAELVEVANSMGLDISGTKADLIERITKA